MASLRSRIKSLAESGAEPALSLPEISPRSRLIDAVKETRKRQSLKDKAEEQRSAEHADLDAKEGLAEEAD